MFRGFWQRRVSPGVRCSLWVKLCCLRFVQRCVPVCLAFRLRWRHGLLVTGSKSGCFAMAKSFAAIKVTEMVTIQGGMLKQAVPLPVLRVGQDLYAVVEMADWMCRVSTN